MTEVIEDGSNGFIVEERNAEAMANAIQKAIALTPQQKENQRTEAFKKLKVNHVQSIQFDGYLDIYESLKPDAV